LLAKLSLLCIYCQVIVQERMTLGTIPEVFLYLPDAEAMAISSPGGIADSRTYLHFTAICTSFRVSLCDERC